MFSIGLVYASSREERPSTREKKLLLRTRELLFKVPYTSLSRGSRESVLKNVTPIVNRYKDTLNSNSLVAAAIFFRELTVFLL